MSENNKSEVARSMRQIDLELEAAGRLEHGVAITVRHDFITARAQRGAERILQLIEEGKHAEAQALMNTENWGVEEPVAAGQGPGKQQRKERKGKKRHA